MGVDVLRRRPGFTRVQSDLAVGRDLGRCRRDLATRIRLTVGRGAVLAIVGGSRRGCLGFLAVPLRCMRSDDESDAVRQGVERGCVVLGRVVWQSVIVGSLPARGGRVLTASVLGRVGSSGPMRSAVFRVVGRVITPGLAGRLGGRGGDRCGQRGCGMEPEEPVTESDQHGRNLVWCIQSVLAIRAPMHPAQHRCSASE